VESAEEFWTRLREKTPVTLTAGTIRGLVELIRARDAAVRLAERERCARVCEAVATIPDPNNASLNDHGKGYAVGCLDCAETVRAIGDTDG
jgi:hypothetical protein